MKLWNTRGGQFRPDPRLPNPEHAGVQGNVAAYPSYDFNPARLVTQHVAVAVAAIRYDQGGACDGTTEIEFSAQIADDSCTLTAQVLRPFRSAIFLLFLFGCFLARFRRRWGRREANRNATCRPVQVLGTKEYGYLDESLAKNVIRMKVWPFSPVAFTFPWFYDLFSQALPKAEKNPRKIRETSP